jgi:hypothetical protein
MGYHPGLDYFALFENTMYQDDAWQIYGKVLEFDVPLGEPNGQYTEENGVWKREFDDGIVYVNGDTADHTVELPKALMLMNGNEEGKQFEAQTTVTIPTQDAWFLVENP